MSLVNRWFGNCFRALGALFGAGRAMGARIAPTQVVVGSHVSKIQDLNCASARITATMAENWDLARIPFDRHQLELFIEDASLPSKDMVFTPDATNSRLGDEIDMAGWTPSAVQDRGATQDLPQQLRRHLDAHRCALGILALRHGRGCAVRRGRRRLFYGWAAWAVFKALG
jgi:hypothetical protein